MSDHSIDDDPPSALLEAPEGDAKSLSRRQKMSAARLERRRAVDRESQRATRARTKAYITHLEETIAAMEKNSTNEQTASLMKTIQRKQAEIDRLSGIVSSVQKLLSSGPSEDDNVQTGDADSSPKFEAIIDLPFSPEPAVPSSSIMQYPNSKNSALAPFTTALRCDFGDRNYYGALNTALEFIQLHGRSIIFTGLTQSVDDDIAIRAVLDGWPAVEQKYDLDPAWQVLKALDQGLYARSERVVRLAHLRNVRDTMIFKLCGEVPYRRQLPKYMTQTELQKTIPHPIVADFFVWPHVRDYLILTKTHVSSERRSAMFASNLRFEWPYELRDVCRRHKETGTYAYSESFDKCINDLSSWWVAPEFNIAAPEVPMLLGPRVSSISGQSQPGRQFSVPNNGEWQEDKVADEANSADNRPFPPWPSSPSNSNYTKTISQPTSASDAYFLSRLPEWPELSSLTADFGWTS